MPLIDARRQGLANISPDGSSNAGLLLDRFLRHPKQDGGGDPVIKARDEVLAAAITQQSPVYVQAYQRWTESVKASDVRAIACSKDLPVQGRLISGLGIASPLETGISLHHTYGVPWLPGTGLKGLAAHYCGTVWGNSNEAFRLTLDEKGNVLFQGEDHKLLFGTNEASGLLVFQDGWWVPDGSSALMLDVMTPHHGDYYMGNQPTATDFDMPVPVSFLSVNGKFSLAVECPCGSEDKEKAQKWADLGLRLITEALASWGFGGKTNAGYGRVGSVPGIAPQVVQVSNSPKATDFDTPNSDNGRKILQFLLAFKEAFETGKPLDPKKKDYQGHLNKWRNILGELPKFNAEEKSCLALYMRQLGPVLLDERTWKGFEAKLPKA